jgi:hypothetical protein
MKKLILINFLVLISGNSFAEVDNTLTIFAYPPKKVLNWKNPKSALFSFISIEINKVLFPGEKINVKNFCFEPVIFLKNKKNP